MRKFQAAEEQELLDGTIVMMRNLLLKSYLNQNQKYLKSQLLKSCLNLNQKFPKCLKNQSQRLNLNSHTLTLAATEMMALEI